LFPCTIIRSYKYAPSDEKNAVYSNYTHLTFVGFVTSVDADVLFVVLRIHEGGVTRFTGVRSLTGVRGLHMIIEQPSSFEGFCAQITRITTVIKMGHTSMRLKVTSLARIKYYLIIINEAEESEVIFDRKYNVELP